MNARSPTKKLKDLNLMVLVWLAVAGACISGCRQQEQAGPAQVLSAYEQLTAESEPGQVVTVFLQAIREYVDYQHSQPTRADSAMKVAANLVSSDVLDNMLTLVNMKLSQIPEQMQEKLFKNIVERWAVIIGFYRDGIDFDNLRQSPADNQSEIYGVRVYVPAQHEGYRRPATILAKLSRHLDGWRVSWLGFAPVEAAESRPAAGLAASRPGA